MDIVSFRPEPTGRAPEGESREDASPTVRHLDFFLEWVLAVLMGTAPLLFLPWGIAPTVMGKEMLVMVLTAAAAILWISRAMATGTIVLARTFWYLPLMVLAVSAGLSTFFSLLPQESLWHIESPAESFAGVVVAVVAAFLSLNAPRPRALAEKALTLFLPLAILLGALNILTLFGLRPFPFDFAASPGFTTLGSENAFAIYMAVAVLLALNAPKFVWLGFWRYVYAAGAVIFFANLFLINFQTAWLLLALGIAVMMGIRLATDRERDIRRIGLLLPLLVMTLVFGLLRQRLVGASITLPVEVSPSRLASVAVATKVLREGPLRLLFGSGPATFVYSWERYHAPELNLTAFWGLRFRQGASGALTALSTLGLIGLGAYLGTLILAFVAVLRRLPGKSPTTGALTAATFALTAAWFVYPANFTLHTLLVTGLGLVVALAVRERKALSFAGQPRQAVVLSLGLVIFLVAVIAGLYRAGERFVAYREAQRGVEQVNRGAEITAALPALVRASAIAPNEDNLQRLLAEALLVRLQNLLAPGANAAPQDLQSVLSAAIQVAQTATRLNALDGNNWATLAAAYESVIPFVDGAERFAQEAYTKWQEVAPLNPFPHVAEARAALTTADKFQLLATQPRTPAERRREFTDQRTRWLDESTAALAKAIELKADYADAHFLLAQVFDRQGNLNEAVKKGEESRRLDPFSVGIAFQLGFLYYKGDRLDEALAEFERAVVLQPNYSNARYFLGLIHDRKGNKDAALKQFEEIEKFNPQNEEVKRIITNLRGGRPALENIVPPAPAPEERQAPPVQEERGKEEKTIE